jgi:hypothetical protein
MKNEEEEESGLIYVSFPIVTSVNELIKTY